ncbi:hypothetical protein [Bradyrhizobium genosp. P]|uniref:hypothetical protein n=1 Tax=Bradyrhizobium genosp. P TaxID=83641 RepID=UPI003CF2C03D
MPLVGTEATGQYWEPVANGPAAQVDLLANDPALIGATLPTTGTIPATTGTYVSAVIISDGFRSISVGAKSNQSGGTISIQRFIDRAGLVLVGAAVVSGAFAAGVGQFATITDDGIAFQSFQITISNTSASAATITNFGVLLSAA